jgi:hypothetical protein
MAKRRKKPAKSRKRPSKKPKVADVEGLEFRLYRVPHETDADSFVPATVNTPGRLFDSIIHRYMRSVGGFKCSDSMEVDMAENELMRSANEKSSEVIDKIDNAINSQSMFECFVLKWMRTSIYGKWLQTVVATFGSDGLPMNTDRKNAITFMPPCELSVRTWAQHLHDKQSASAVTNGPIGRGCLAKSIETYIGGLSTATKQAGPQVGDQMHTEYLRIFKATLNKWRDEEDEEDRSAPVFIIGDELNAMYAATFEHKLGWSYKKRLEVWTTFLCQANIIGRGSDVTQFCPVWEDVKVPNKLDADGLPAWIIVKLRDWKWRKTKRRGGKPLEFLIKRNYLDPRFCFIFNLFMMSNVFGYKGGKEKGRIFGKTFNSKNSKAYIGALKHMFVTASTIPGYEHLEKCSSHSVRRTFAQWADTCGYDPFAIMEIGRWTDVPTLRIYVDANRNAQKKNLLLDPKYENPGFKLWLFETEVFAD